MHEVTLVPEAPDEGQSFDGLLGSSAASWVCEKGCEADTASPSPARLVAQVC